MFVKVAPVRDWIGGGFCDKWELLDPGRLGVFRDILSDSLPRVTEFL